MIQDLQSQGIVKAQEDSGYTERRKVQCSRIITIFKSKQDVAKDPN
jgi:hypothetical protein